MFWRSRVPLGPEALCWGGGRALAQEQPTDNRQQCPGGILCGSLLLRPLGEFAIVWLCWCIRFILQVRFGMGLGLAYVPLGFMCVFSDGPIFMALLQTVDQPESNPVMGEGFTVGTTVSFGLTTMGKLFHRHPVISPYKSHFLTLYTQASTWRTHSHRQWKRFLTGTIHNGFLPVPAHSMEGFGFSSLLIFPTQTNCKDEPQNQAIYFSWSL